MKTNYFLKKRSASEHKMFGWSALLLCYLFCPILLFSQTDIQSISLPEGFQMNEDHSMKVFSDELYFVASDGANGIQDALLKYDGVAASQVSLPTDTRVAQESAMQVYDGDLYLVLDDGSSGIYGALYKYNGSTFTHIALPESSEILERTDMVVYDDELYMVLENGSLYKYDGVDIVEVGLPENYTVEYPSDMEVYNESLFLVLEGENDGLYEFDGNSFSQIVMPETYGIASNGTSLTVFKDELYFTIGDGSVGIRGLLHKYDGETVSQVLASNYEVQEEYGMEIYAGHIYMVINDGEDYGGYYKFDGTHLYKIDLGENLVIEEEYDWGVFEGKLFGVFSDYDQNLNNTLMALTANLDAIPSVKAGNCGRNILEFEEGAYAHVGTITDFSYAAGTFEGWIKKDRWTDAYDDALFSNGIGFPFENSFYISFHYGVGLHFRYGGQSEAGSLAAYASTTSTDTLTNGSWHHIAATWYNDGTETQLVTYIDGIEIANQISSENILLSGNQAFGIGEGVLNYLSDFDGGAMSEIRLWNIAKSQEEIVADKDLLMTGLESGLIAYWPLDDAQGSNTAANLVQPDEEAVLADFADVSNAWVNYPMEIRAEGKLVLKNGTFDFGMVPINESSGISFTITNNGFRTMDLVGSPITSLLGDTDQFTIDLSETLNTLENGESTTFTINFQPADLVQKSVSFSLSNFEICSDVYEITVTGTGLNDNCASATELAVYPTGEGDYTVGSTELAGIFEGSLACEDDGTVNDVWYKFTMGSTGSVEIDIDLGTAPYMSGAYYLDCNGEALICLSPVPEKLYLPIAPGTDVYLQLWNSETDAGTFSIRINEAPNTWAYNGFSTTWSAGTSPQPEDDALILTEYQVQSNEPLIVNNLELVNDAMLYGGMLNVNTGSYVKVNGDLTNNGGIIVQSGGSLVTMGEVATVDFDILMEYVFLGIGIVRNTTFDQNTGRYSIVGSPVEATSFSMLGDEALVYAYDESAPYIPSGNQGLDRFRTPTQLELPGMEPGVGYFSAFTGDENGTVFFLGTPNHGTIEVDLSFTDQGAVEEEPYEGFNLVSNPYPAAISVESFFDGNSSVDMDAAVYIWDDYGSGTGRGTNADYIVVNDLGNTSTNSRADGEERFDGNIRSMQGFFVKANSSGQTLQFTDAMKVIGNNSDGGYFRAAASTKFKIGLSNEHESKATIVGYVDDATLAKDNAYDALHMAGSDLQLYTLMSGGEKLAIQGVPASYSGDVQIGFNTATASVHSFSLMDLEVGSPSVWLFDKYDNKQVDLTEESYTFTTESGQFNDRFVMRIASPLALSENRPLIYAYDKILTIETNRSQPAAYRLFDLSGHEVLMAVITGPTVIDLNHLSNGVY
ncbi:MAG: LamG-like jellyroll fold domain-containing protein, partial [Cyclobacteriaceae bacterium]